MFPSKEKREALPEFEMQLCSAMLRLEMHGQGIAGIRDAALQRGYPFGQLRFGMQFFWWSRIGLPSVTEQRELDLMSLVKRGSRMDLLTTLRQCFLWVLGYVSSRLLKPRWLCTELINRVSEVKVCSASLRRFLSAFLKCIHSKPNLGSEHRVTVAVDLSTRWSVQARQARALGNQELVIFAHGQGHVLKLHRACAKELLLKALAASHLDRALASENFGRFIPRPDEKQPPMRVARLLQGLVLCALAKDSKELRGRRRSVFLHHSNSTHGLPVTWFEGGTASFLLAQCMPATNGESDSVIRQRARVVAAVLGGQCLWESPDVFLQPEVGSFVQLVAVGQKPVVSAGVPTPPQDMLSNLTQRTCRLANGIREHAHWGQHGRKSTMLSMGRGLGMSGHRPWERTSQPTLMLQLAIPADLQQPSRLQRGIAYHAEGGQSFMGCDAPSAFQDVSFHSRSGQREPKTNTAYTDVPPTALSCWQRQALVAIRHGSALSEPSGRIDSETLQAVRLSRSTSDPCWLACPDFGRCSCKVAAFTDICGCAAADLGFETARIPAEVGDLACLVAAAAVPVPFLISRRFDFSFELRVCNTLPAVLLLPAAGLAIDCIAELLGDTTLVHGCTVLVLAGRGDKIPLFSAVFKVFLIAQLGQRSTSDRSAFVVSCVMLAVCQVVRFRVESTRRRHETAARKENTDDSWDAARAGHCLDAGLAFEGKFENADVGLHARQGQRMLAKTSRTGGQTFAGYLDVFCRGAEGVRILLVAAMQSFTDLQCILDFAAIKLPRPGTGLCAALLHGYSLEDFWELLFGDMLQAFDSDLHPTSAARTLSRLAFLCSVLEGFAVLSGASPAERPSTSLEAKCEQEDFLLRAPKLAVISPYRFTLREARQLLEESLRFAGTELPQVWDFDYCVVASSWGFGHGKPKISISFGLPHRPDAGRSQSFLRAPSSYDASRVPCFHKIRTAALAKRFLPNGSALSV
ncbi:hypothetical protein AK812_SmicGene40964 [Symbiodinium microadriaticum]|uniref:Uncharacterized protein n=1 Tax=Symbiodinium microadriaticum TaxID=2951 RepID=A0A1Q9C7G3_SYMMI|nr:hypothetical protein AK812_SmicGene40964 [Symbiodinium microadriaticum]